MPRKSDPYSNNRAKIHHVCSSWAFWRAYLALVFSPPSHEPEHLVAGIGLDFRFDLGSEPLQFPTEVAATTLRPDVVIYSRTEKIVIMLELTVPLEDRSHLAHDRKTSKYAPLAPTCEENGFTTHVFALEVGCLGFCTHTFLTCFDALGLPKSSARQIRTECARVALRCSYLLYLRRGIALWNDLESALT